MGAPKRKTAPPAKTLPTRADREAAEDRADAKTLRRAAAEWEANGRPSVSLAEAKRLLGDDK